MRVDAAHRGAKEAITELRDLAHGIHPPLLDRGLGAALATLAARSDPPVELVVDLPERPSAAIETIAYFCAAELLANVAKHSGARHATMEAVHMPGLLRVRVSDDGAGGARLEARGGLAGLADRVRTVDGRLQISSPPGGPTYIETRYAADLLGAASGGGAAGVGYLLKDRVADVGEFVEALSRVAAGGTALDPEVVTQLLGASRRTDGLGSLTARERDVLALMAEGRSNGAIAGILVVSERGVEKHVGNIFSKLGLAPSDADHRRVLAVLRYLES